MRVSTGQVFIYFSDKKELFHSSGTSLQSLEVSSTEKKCITRSQVQNIKKNPRKNLFDENINEEPSTHSCEAEDTAITSSHDIDIFEDSGDEYVPSSEGDSDSDTHSHSSDDNAVETNFSNIGTNKETQIITKGHMTNNVINMYLLLLPFFY